AILDWSFSENVGFSAFISIGSMLDVDWGDLIGYLGQDPNTKSIVIYMESIGNARSFLSAAREVALTKPIIVIKAGRSEAAAKAAASHTGSLTGSDEVLDAAFRRCGVLRVNEISDIFYLAEVLAKQPRPKGPNLTILTNAGGPGVLATDALIIDGGKLTKISEETIENLNKILPTHWSHGNPIDILGDAGPDRYAKSLEIAAKDPNSDGLLVILTPQAMTDPSNTAEKLKPFANIENKPVLASWMGGDEVNQGKMILNNSNIPTFSHPDVATRIFNYMWKYSYNLKALYETPTLPRDYYDGSLERTAAEEIIESALAAKRTILTEYESKKLMASYGIPTVETEIATTEEEAGEYADKIGYPIVLKLYSFTITHKTDVGGVVLNLENKDAVKKAFTNIKKSVTEKVGIEHFQGVTVQPMVKLEGYELIIGSSLDPQFGPVLLFGTGGQLVEVFKDSALGLPPLNSTLARRMMEQTKIFKALQGVRGRKSVDISALEELMVKFSQLVAEQPWIKEIDINPLLASPEKLLALDARVVLHSSDMKEEDLPKAAIRPYPKQYVSLYKMNDGSKATIRPIRPEDEHLMADLHKTLSERSVYLHFSQVFQLNERIEHERLTRICFNDYDREIALVVDQRDASTGKHAIMAIARLSKIQGTQEGTFVILVGDPYQGKGLGTVLLGRLLQIAKDEKISCVSANILTENKKMQDMCEKLGFKISKSNNPNVVKATIKL
ncbi:MAG TPA: acetyl CoA synthetase subunit alpha, partial [Rikenellaceae bacterium]|nr:acetyl CoA synthetase subunit alpha [Rikenellaceae bacterium]